MKKLFIGTGLVISMIFTITSCSSNQKEENSNLDRQVITIANINYALSNLSNYVVSSKLSASLNSALLNLDIDDNVDIKLLGLSNSYSIMSEGMSISYTINTKYSLSTNFVVLNAKVFSNNNPKLSGTKIIKIIGKYDFNSDLAKFSNIISNKTSLVLNHDVINTNPTTTQLGFLEPSLSHGTMATYTIESKEFIGTSYKNVILHLTNNNQIATKTFKLWPKYDFTNEKQLFHDITSSKNASQLNAIMSTLSGPPTANDLGFGPLKLNSNTVVAYSLSSHNFSGTTSILVTAHLSHNFQTAVVRFNLTPSA